MIMCEENPKESTKKLLEQVQREGKLINKNEIAFSYTNQLHFSNKQWESEIKITVFTTT